MRVRDAAATLSNSESEDQLKQLDEALVESTYGEQEDIDALFRMFEQHPDSDGFGVFWSALHWLEAQSLDIYERALLESIRRKPVPFTLNMVNRMLNGGLDYAADVSLLSLLNDVAVRSDISSETRAEALEVLARHGSGTGQSA